MRTFILLSFAFLLTCFQSGATTLTLTGTGGQAVGGVYGAPYYASIDGAFPSLSVVCLDVYRHNSVGDVWDVSVKGIFDSGLEFGDSLDKYKTAAVLWTQMQQDSTLYGAGQYAIWNLFNPTFSTAPVDPAASVLKAAAVQFVADNPNANYSGITIYTPTSHGTSNDLYQELMTGQVTATPEPATFAVMGIALLGLGAWHRKKLHR